MRQSPTTETPQPNLSYEPCGKLRRFGLDETSILVGARHTVSLSRMLTQSFHGFMKIDKKWPISHLFFIFIKVIMNYDLIYKYLNDI